MRVTISLLNLFTLIGGFIAAWMAWGIWPAFAVTFLVYYNKPIDNGMI